MLGYQVILNIMYNICGIVLKNYEKYLLLLDSFESLKISMIFNIIII